MPRYIATMCRSLGSSSTMRMLPRVILCPRSTDGVLREIAFVAEPALDGVKHTLVELLALLAVLVGSHRLATHTMLDPRRNELLDRVRADLDRNHGVVVLLDHDADAQSDAHVAVEPPGTLPRALPSDADEDQGHGVCDELGAGARSELLEQESPHVAVDLPRYPPDQ